MVIVAPSLLSADFGRLEEQIRAVEAAGADWIHCDVMDGHFVPNITFGPVVVEAANRVTDLPIDVHLMIEQPDRYVPDFISAGADYVTVHVETCPHLHRSIQLIRSLGAKPGVSLNPSTPISSLEEIIVDVDLVLVMSVSPGFGGQKFIPSSLQKIERLAALIQERKPGVLIAVDGGVGTSNVGELVRRGTTVLVAGSAVFGKPDLAAAIQELRQAGDDAC